MKEEALSFTVIYILLLHGLKYLTWITTGHKCACILHVGTLATVPFFHILSPYFTDFLLCKSYDSITGALEGKRLVFYISAQRKTQL